MDDPERPPTAAEVRRIRRDAKLTQTELASLLGLSRYNTISDWERGAIERTTGKPMVPSITLRELVEAVTLHTHPASVHDAHRRDRDYTLALLALIKGDAIGIAASAARQLDKLEIATAYLRGEPSPTVSEASETEESRETRREGSAAPMTARRAKGRR